MSWEPPLSVDDPRAPRYWKDETSGVLAPAVMRYIRRDPLTPADIAALRAYIRLWVFSPVWDMNPYADEAGLRELAGLRDAVDSLTNRAQIDRWLSRAINIGIDPF